MANSLSFTALAFFLACLASAAQGAGLPQTVSSTPQASFVVCLDPGHPSEVSAGDALQNGVREVVIVWQVAQRMQTHLASAGVQVVLTRHGEREMVTNRKRAEIANTSGARLMLRLHCDTGKHRGFAVYYPDKQGTAEGRTGPSPDIIRRSHDAAICVHEALRSAITPDLPDNGLKGDSQTFIGSKQGALTGSIFSAVPVVLVEMAVLSNPQDASFIGSPDGQERMARALAAGVVAAGQKIQFH